MCVCVCSTCVCHKMHEEARVQLCGVCSLIYHIGPRDGIQVIRVCGKCFCPLNQTPSPLIHFSPFASLLLGELCLHNLLWTVLLATHYFIHLPFFETLLISSSLMIDESGLIVLDVGLFPCMCKTPWCFLLMKDCLHSNCMASWGYHCTLAPLTHWRVLFSLIWLPARRCVRCLSQQSWVKTFLRAISVLKSVGLWGWVSFFFLIKQFSLFLYFFTPPTFLSLKSSETRQGSPFVLVSCVPKALFICCPLSLFSSCSHCILFL